MKTKLAIRYATHILDLWLPEKMKAASIPGISIGIIHNKQLVFETGYGFADVEKKIKMTSDTLYPIASISKIFTALAIMQLVESKKISLSDSIVQYLPWFTVNNNISNSKNITIRNLLDHTSGIWRDGNTYHWYNDDFPTEEMLKENITSDAIKIKRNSKFKYSNYGYALLGLIIEKISGEKYSNYIEKNISSKLGLTSTNINLLPFQKKSYAQGYGLFSPINKREKFSLFPQTHVYAPATGFISNIKDLAKLISSFSTKNQIISPKTLNIMIKPRHKTDDNAHYGLGFDILTLDNKKLFGHSGGFSGYTLNISYDPKDDIGVIVLTNTINGRAQGLTLGIFDTIFKVKNKYSKYFTTIGTADMKEAEGFYESRWGSEVIIAMGKHYLSLELYNNFPLKSPDILESRNDGTYIVKSESKFGMNGESVRFKKDSKTGKSVIDYGSGISYKQQ